MSRILVIDDEEFIREMVAQALSDQGFTVFTAEDGERGVALARKELPDLILCDISMPNLGGYDVLISLRKIPSTATIPFVFMTGESDRMSMRLGMDLGADDYLTKPFTIPELISAVETRLKKRELLETVSERKLEDLRASLTLSLPHELRTPLQGILGFSDLLLAGHDKLKSGEIADLAGRIRKSASRLHRLVENFLIYAQIELIAYDEEQLESLKNRPAERVKELLQNQIRQKAEQSGRGGDFVVSIADVAVPMGAEYLSKIATELIDNAIKFSQKSTPVNVTTESGNGQFILTVADKGQGMSPEQIAAIGGFMQFNRKLHEQQGTGMGLAIARRLAALYGGTLSLESEQGKGTTVRVTLPQRAE